MGMPLSVNREQLIKQMTDYVINVLEEKRPEFSGLAVCPFVKADRLANQLHLDVFDNQKEDLASVIMRFVKSKKRSALIAQINEEIPSSETYGYQEFINILIEEMHVGNLAALCFNPNDTLEVEGHNPRSKAPCFLINIGYRDKLRKAQEVLLQTKYYDKLPDTYKKYLIGHFLKKHLNVE